MWDPNQQSNTLLTSKAYMRRTTFRALYKSSKHRKDDDVCTLIHVQTTGDSTKDHYKGCNVAGVIWVLSNNNGATDHNKHDREHTNHSSDVPQHTGTLPHQHKCHLWLTCLILLMFSLSNKQVHKVSMA